MTYLRIKYKKRSENFTYLTSISQAKIYEDKLGYAINPGFITLTLAGERQ